MARRRARGLSIRSKHWPLWASSKRSRRCRRCYHDRLTDPSSGSHPTNCTEVGDARALSLSRFSHRGARLRRLCRAAALGAMARSRRAGHREGSGRAARVERDQERRLDLGDPGARALVSRRLGRPHLPHHGDRRRRGARRQAGQASDGGPGVPASRRRGRRPEADARGSGARREDGRSCGRRRPGRERPTTRATSAAASPRRRRSRTARWSTRTSGPKASTSTSSTAR